jgi:hypothetical protein
MKIVVGDQAWVSWLPRLSSLEKSTLRSDSHPIQSAPVVNVLVSFNVRRDGQEESKNLERGMLACELRDC